MIPDSGMPHEVLLVHQDDVTAKVHLDRSDGIWSVRVVELQQPDRSVSLFGHAVAAGRHFEEARTLGRAKAREEIAHLLGRPVSKAGHTLRAAAVQRLHGSGFDAVIEVVDANGFTTERLVVSPVGRDELSNAEALALANQHGYGQVSGITATGKIVL
ncbi:hypothetical protein [Xanthomonas vesicatoria]|uniref:Uncharacterized protein n=1 Tax=Xanthomonas vesicatoria TaxID=56460 RepID=A0ABS8LEY9_9XANT|nr:hypothetical protein [Xanthomonas vesicatoria]MCC8624319.1 hypothetical protein [Xanthomonas vesicatoria]MCC8696138.1 hypothetical protein [Xanthomonas vesicatoria]MCC8704574.1 hypothetical protein [Xanthomonas vesicatoria]MDG4491791.1 hypothetical protein [Xanthomonas vesicatoria]